MMKTIAMATLLAAAFAMPALAEDTPAKPDREAMKAERFEQMKAKHAEMHKKGDAKIEERRAAWDAHRDDCYKKMQAAETPEKAKYVREQCKGEGKAMHDKFRAEREANKDKWEAKRGEMKAKRDAKKAEWEAKKAERKAAATSGE